MGANAERGACFHPTIGSATPNGFTTSHPRAETTMLRYCVLVFLWLRMRVTLPLLCYHSLCVFPDFSSSLCICPQSLLPHALSSCEVVCGMISPTLVRPDGSTDGRFTPPSLINSWGAIYLPACETFNSGPMSRSWFSGPVKSKYYIVLGGS